MSQSDALRAITLRVRLARRFYRLRQPDTLRVEIDNFTRIVGKIAFGLDSPSPSTSCITPRAYFSYINSKSIGIRSFQEPDIESMTDSHLPLQPCSIAQSPFFPTRQASVIQVIFSCILANRINQAAIFQCAANCYRVGILNPIVSETLPVLKLKNLRCKRIQFDISPVSSSPISMRLTRSNETELLSKAHNELLFGIGKGLQFIGQMDATLERYEQLKREIHLWVKRIGAGKTRQKIWAEYPGAAALFLVLGAIYEYRHGDYWDLVLDNIGVSNTAPAQGYWGKRFILFTLAFGRYPFQESGLRYVGSILDHAMIPNDCLPEFFGQLLEPAVRFPAWTGRSAQELIKTWLNRSSSYIGVDKPVWRFLRHGGNLAEEFVSEALKMVRYRYDNGLLPDEKDINLPVRIVQAYKTWLHRQGDPPSSRRPFIKLDPFACLQLAFPDQKLSDDCKGQVCSWRLSVAGKPYKGAPSNYPQARGGDLTFSASPISLPTDGPYEVKLVVGDKTFNEWSLDGITSRQPWKAFMGRTCREINTAFPIRAEQTWFVVPNDGSVSVLDHKGFLLPDYEISRCNLIEEWNDYQAILVELSTADAIKICCRNDEWTVKIERIDGETTFTGGDLLQAAEARTDNVDLFGDSPPDIVMTAKPGDEILSLDHIRLRIAGLGILGSVSYEYGKDDLVQQIRIEPGRIILNIGQLVKPDLCPGQIRISLWFNGKRLSDHTFCWVPNLASRTIGVGPSQPSEIRRFMYGKWLIIGLKVLFLWAICTNRST